MKINWSKVLVGGVIAGIVIIALDMVNQTYILGPKSIAELDAFKPGLGAMMSQGSGLIVFLLCDILLGILLVWVYAAIRPRFGPGPQTAVKAAIPLWVSMGIPYYGWVQLGMMSLGLWASYSIVELVIIIVAAMAGAKFYSEDAAA